MVGVYSSLNPVTILTVCLVSVVGSNDEEALYDPTKTVYPGNNINFGAILFFSHVFQSNIEHTHAGSV